MAMYIRLIHVREHFEVVLDVTNSIANVYYSVYYCDIVLVLVRFVYYGSSVWSIVLEECLSC